MNKKKVIIFGIGIFLVTLLFFVFVAISAKKTSEVPSRRPTPPVAISSPTEVLDDKIIIDGVKVDNIYKKPIRANKEEDAVFFKNDNYEFTYLPKFNKFIITITGSPFLSWIEKAEDDFVSSLGIAKADACKLNVEVATPLFANPEYAGKAFPLSFCK